jgi:hypothetical protein
MAIAGAASETVEVDGFAARFTGRVASDGRSFVIFQNNQFADQSIERPARLVSHVRSRASAPIPRSALICERRSVCDLSLRLGVLVSRHRQCLNVSGILRICLCALDRDTCLSFSSSESRATQETSDQDQQSDVRRLGRPREFVGEGRAARSELPQRSHVEIVY